ncbi:Mycothiol maleylpyruvate isomerase N-terminal domain protein [Mycolicibacterium phlei]|uniref:DinB family protein n=1 Tax=Mycobacteroides chelonae TaxID=1774 RepID=UPI000618C27E|nr:DinB family protein [Mycobacteroides chelonae]VEG17318.1 Mycothiol maleylpyruvate isomerase N-terminal domain protein [Mycolicibacterium phlei]AKC39262.1 methyltransferase type 12 [Mycobacteroides chelonae]ANA98698.1 methyltransferase type 12 [Mycobacteroides chelonae CCUG 47445]OLT72457.1 methyltransferase type 12 [Mycobacteroides chelonae]ORV11780.1 methyltransferase type 12 [Mycobacteroides chelonae]
MPITPDTKDWTWVLDNRCTECGFDPATTSFTQIPDIVRDNLAAWQPVLSRPEVRQRPDEQTWSPLEYGAHVRDVFRIFLTRLQLMLAEEDPFFENWDQDKTAIEDRYAAQDPQTVARELSTAGEAIATAFAGVPASSLNRRGRRSNGSVFTVETLGLYFVHDPVHHLHDVSRLPAD